MEDPPLIRHLRKEPTFAGKPGYRARRFVVIAWGDRVFLTTTVGGNTDLRTGNYGGQLVKDESKLVSVSASTSARKISGLDGLRACRRSSST